MKFALLDQIRCSCGSEEFRLEGAVTRRSLSDGPAEAVRCRRFCGLRQRPVLPGETRPPDCRQCYGQIVLEGVIRCTCGKDWPIVDGIPAFSTKRVGRTSTPGLFLAETNPRTDPRWEPFVSAHPNAIIYHHPGWIRALEEEYGQRRVHFACEDADGRLMAVLPMFYTRGFPLHLGGNATRRRLSSLPRTPLAGPLSVSREATAALLQAAVDRARQEPGLQIQLKAQSLDLDGLVDGVVCRPWRTSYVLKLPPSPEGLQFGNSTARHRIKWAVNKAAKLGVQVREAIDEKDLRAWYELYLDAMRRNAVPARPYRFFQAIWALLAPSGLMRLLLAERVEAGQRRLLAGSIILTYGRTACYAFTGCRKEDLALHPNDTIQWHAIHDACRKGFEWYDFGEVAEEHQQLAQFKGKWGAEPVPLYRYYYPAPQRLPFGSQTTSQWIGQLRAAAWSRLPLSTTARLGDWIYSYL